jgi:type VI secretion system protein ImpH
VASEKWQSYPPLKDRLFKEFFKFSFYRAVHLLESLFPEKKRIGQALSPKEEPVRFSVKPSFVFPPSDISHLEQPDEAKAVTMEVAFMGMIGPSAVLPHWYNDLALERLKQKDHVLISFLNLFHHRLISLLYLAWKKHRLEINYLLDAKDRFSQYLLSLIGLGTPGLTKRVGFPLESIIFHSGHLSKLIPSAISIESIVEYFVDTKVRVEQFISRLIGIHLEDQTQLGSANSRLGVDALCGNSAWESQTKFRLHIGSVGFDHFLRLLPSGKILGHVFSLVRYRVGPEYEFDLLLYLKREEVPPCQLGMETPGGPRLGWTTWIKSPGFTHTEDPHAIFGEPKN